jgi:hypothetical protein
MIDGGSVLLRCHTSPRAQSRGIFHVRSSLPSLPLAQTDTARDVRLVVRFQGQSGLYVLGANISPFDPKRASIANMLV